jgi:pyridoxal phosphate enzyme (YggS family)
MEGFREACLKAARSPSEVKLVAVSKTFPAESVAQAYELGQRLFGENRVQELVDKQPALPKDIEWHFIGRLQRNKVKYIIDKVALIHSVDSVGLAREISRHAVIKGVEVPVLIQVNLGGEESKAGFYEEGLRQGVTDVAGLPGVRIQGLMTIGPYFEDPEEARPLFRRMKTLIREVAGWNIPGTEIRLLSMGMSHDYKVAIEEGADIVRVGSAIFGWR